MSRSFGTLIPIALAGWLAGCTRAAEAQETQPPPAIVKELFGQPMTEDQVEAVLERERWVDDGGVMVDFPAHPREVELRVSLFRRGQTELLVASAVVSRLPSGVPVWRITDAVQMPLVTEDDEIGWNCKIGLRGEFVPGLIAMVGSNIAQDTGESALLGPARYAWHMDRLTGQLQAEELPVYCNKEDYGV